MDIRFAAKCWAYSLVLSVKVCGEVVRLTEAPLTILRILLSWCPPPQIEIFLLKKMFAEFLKFYLDSIFYSCFVSRSIISREVVVVLYEVGREEDVEFLEQSCQG